MISKSELIEFYVNQQLTESEIAIIFNCSKRTVRKYRQSYKIPTHLRKIGTSNRVKKISDEQFIVLTKESISYCELIRKCGGNPNGGGGYYSTKKRISDLNLDISHFKGQGWNFIRKQNCNPAVSLEELLVENSSIGSSKLKPRLIRENILKNECYKCGLKDFWQNEPIVLQLEHINGIRTDNRIENLCILCPNCHSQTFTFCRSKSSLNNKSKKLQQKENNSKVSNIDHNLLYIKTINHCLECNKEISLKARRCKSCVARSQKTKIEWVSDEELARMIKESSFVSVGEKLGVSDNAVRKRLKSRNIILQCG